MIEKMPRWALIVLAGGCLIISGAWIKTANADIREQRAVNIDQEARLKALERLCDKMDDKLDRIAERVGARVS